MGTYKKIRIDANTQNYKNLKIIANLLEKHEAEDCWQKFCDDTKWWPDELLDELTKKLPKVMFCVQYAGEETSTHYIYNGQSIEEHLLFHAPRFPSLKNFNETKNREVKNDAAYKKRRTQADKKIAAKEKQIEKLEQEIAKINQQV